LIHFYKRISRQKWYIMSFEKVVGSVGHLLLNADGAILASGGELQNDESTTKKLFQFISAATKGDFGTEVEKISINYADHCYVIGFSNNKLHIVKKNVSGDVYA